MKKVLFALLSVVFVAGSASAMPLQLDASEALGAGYGQTGTFDSMQFFGTTVSTDNADGTFSDDGNLTVTELLGLVGSSAALNVNPTDAAEYGITNNWYLVGVWEDMTGTSMMTDADSAKYTYLDGDLYLYATSTFESFTGIQVAKLSLINGTGSLDGIVIDGNTGAGTAQDGKVLLNWKFEEILQGFWLDGNGQELSLVDLNQGEFIVAIADANTHNITIQVNPDQTSTIYSDHDGSVTIGVVPEPASMVLFGTGLFGLAGAGLRKRFAA